MPKVVHSSGRPVLAKCLNHKLPLYVFTFKDQQAIGIGALNMNWPGLTACAYPSTIVMSKSDTKDTLVKWSCNSHRSGTGYNLIMGPSDMPALSAQLIPHRKMLWRLTYWSACL